MADIYELHYITKRKLAYEFCISDVTVAKTFREIYPYKNILLDNTITNSYVAKISTQLENEKISPEILERMKKFGVATDQYTVNPKIIQNNDIDKKKNKINHYISHFGTSISADIKLIQKINIIIKSF